MASEEIVITGGKPCSGSIQISGAKNAALPLMASCMLTDKPVTLYNVPQISDVELMKKQLRSYGVTVTDNGSTLRLQAASRGTGSSPKNAEGSKTRAAFLVLGPLLARFGTAKVYLPGGCKIVKEGNRPVDYHMEALQRMGARSEPAYGDYVVLKANQGLRGARIHFPQISVGATENIVMAACLARGETEIRNAAVEPEVNDLVNMLKKMGANIQVYEDQNRIVVNGGGGSLLGGCTHTVIPDRIEAGTYAIAAAMTGGTLLLKMDPSVGRVIMANVLEKLRQAGVSVNWKDDGFEIQRAMNAKIRPVNVTTGAFPGFPTDLLPQWVTLMTLASGPSIIEDTIYNNRFSHVQYLKEMGATFTRISDTRYQVHGGAHLRGTRVKATDLRAGAALVLAGLAATGITVVKEFQHVLRGYENIKEKLKCWRGNGL